MGKDLNKSYTRHYCLSVTSNHKHSTIQEELVSSTSYQSIRKEVPVPPVPAHSAPDKLVRHLAAVTKVTPSSVDIKIEFLHFVYTMYSVPMFEYDERYIVCSGSSIRNVWHLETETDNDIIMVDQTRKVLFTCAAIVFMRAFSKSGII